MKIIRPSNSLLDLAATVQPPQQAKSRSNWARRFGAVIQRLEANGFNRSQAVDWLVEQGQILQKNRQKAYIALTRLELRRKEQKRGPIGQAPEATSPSLEAHDAGRVVLLTLKATMLPSHMTYIEVAPGRYINSAHIVEFTYAPAKEEKRRRSMKDGYGGRMSSKETSESVLSIVLTGGNSVSLSGTKAEDVYELMRPKAG